MKESDQPIPRSRRQQEFIAYLDAVLEPDLEPAPKKKPVLLSGAQSAGDAYLTGGMGELHDYLEKNPLRE